jgi:hypothetical protein
MLANDLGADPKPAIEASIFIGLKRQKGFAPPVTSLGIEEADRDKMHEKAKRDLPDAVAMPAQEVCWPCWDVGRNTPKDYPAGN